jgi:hypothetical protein
MSAAEGVYLFSQEAQLASVGPGTKADLSDLDRERVDQPSLTGLILQASLADSSGFSCMTRGSLLQKYIFSCIPPIQN